jgi:hypothetical protein
MKFRGTLEYEALISSIDANIITFNDMVDDNYDADSRNVIIRHDVDVDLDRALNFAREENKLGVQSTYFLLHSSRYFDYSNEFSEKCQELIELGHNIGLHNDSLVQYFSRRKKDIQDHLNKPLDFLRENGIEIRGTSCHGQRCCYAAGYLNYEVWSEFDPSKNEGFEKEDIPKVSLEEFNLEYETYFVDYDAYLSDSGKKWRGVFIEGKKNYERSMFADQNNLGTNIIDKFNKQEQAVLQLLCHPIHWK